MRVLIVGAGLAGATVANVLAHSGIECDVIDQRDHVAGNVFDFISHNGTRIHKYGPHIFHTNNETVWSFLKNFTSWTKYEHKVKSFVPEYGLVTFPPNDNVSRTFQKSEILEVFYRPYSEKMWGKKLEDVHPSILNRVPTADGDEERYFPTDKYQGLPSEGYTKLVENMLDHNRINIQLKQSFDITMEDGFDHIFNSMPIDQYFGFDQGELEYRSIKFHTVTLPINRISNSPQVNFTDKSKYTRFVEWKNFPNHSGLDQETTITFEEPCDPSENFNAKFYPVKDINGINKEIYKNYKSRVPKKVNFIGRLGTYSYINMDQAINSSLNCAKSFLNGVKR